MKFEFELNLKRFEFKNSVTMNGKTYQNVYYIKQPLTDDNKGYFLGYEITPPTGYFLDSSYSNAYFAEYGKTGFTPDYLRTI